ncbi:MAG: phosphate ABC transporter substrate-binding protein [Treponema sp.]|jgi:phosphate transport system substrate-binding protein|nr:phosphate ABC transporter substrate-binding protein [Treponema sp.]
MKSICIVLALSLAIMGNVFAGGGSQSTEQKAGPVTITIAGSTSVNPLMELLTGEYAKLKDNIRFNISATGSGDGIKAVPAETAEIGMSSRELTPAELGTGIDKHVIAIDGIAVIVNKDNPVSNLTAGQIRDIYTGKITDWSQLGGGKAGKIAVVSREPGSGTRGAFEEILKFQDQLVKGSVEFDGTGAIKAEISRNVDAVGYISLGSVDGSVKTLSVDGIAPATENVVNGSYVIARPFLLLTKGGKPLNPETKAFLDWILSPAGQALVKTSWISVL